MKDIVTNKKKYLEDTNNIAMLGIKFGDNNTNVTYTISSDKKYNNGLLSECKFSISDSGDFVHIFMQCYDRVWWNGHLPDSTIETMIKEYIPHSGFTIVDTNDILSGYRLNELYDNKKPTTQYIVDGDCGWWISKSPILHRTVKIPLHIPSTITYENYSIQKYISPLLLSVL